MSTSTVREWYIEMRCENCTFVKKGWARDSEANIKKEVKDWLCPKCGVDSLMVYLKNLGRADLTKPRVPVKGAVWT